VDAAEPNMDARVAALFFPAVLFFVFCTLHARLHG
jgi:hypothetical protein